MTGRQGDASGWGAVRNWFETLPFHRGMSLLGIVVVIPAVVIGGTLMLGGGSKTSAARPPSASTGVRTPPAPRDTWGAYVPPRKTHPPRTQRGSMILERPVPTLTQSPRPTPSTSCPAEWKQWRWLWDICRRNTSGNTGR